MKRALSRRDVLQLGLLGAAATLRTHAAAGRRELLTTPVRVPSDFVGIHAHRWPQGTPPSPPPAYAYGAVRSHDYGIAWNNIAVAPGNFDWTRMDVWVQTHAAAGKTLIYTVYGTPAWASSRSAVMDAYGHMGAGAPPSTLSVLRDFVTALVLRYNTAGERRIHFIEQWNEPHFLQNDRGFWWGTVEQLADMGRTITQAAKASDPGIKILSPAFDGLPQGRQTVRATSVSAGLQRYLAARDSTGAEPSQWFDGLSIHTYDAAVAGPAHGLEGTLLQVKETLRQHSINVPIYTTETGYSERAPFNSMAVERQASALRRQAAVQAALGVQMLCFYSHDDGFCGNPSRHPELSAAIDDVHRHIAGATLRRVSVLSSGQVSVVTGSDAFTW